MAEGDSIARLAARLDSVTAGCVIAASDVRHPRFATADLAGQRIVGWVPRGKHLLMRTDAGITVHSHLRMSGRWTVLGTGKRLPRDVAARLRIALRLHDDRTLAGIDLPVLTVVRTGDEHQVVGHLGPDLLGGSTATDEGLARAAARVVAAGAQPVVAALLDQRRVAGLGNMWAQELLFLHGIDPRRPASATDPVPLLVDARRRLRHAVDHDPAQSTTGGRSPRHWVYGRARRPCLRCATVSAGSPGTSCPAITAHVDPLGRGVQNRAQGTAEHRRWCAVPALRANRTGDDPRRRGHGASARPLWLRSYRFLVRPAPRRA